MTSQVPPTEPAPTAGGRPAPLVVAASLAGVEGAALLLLRGFVPDGLPPLALLAVYVAAGVAVYGILVDAFGLDAQADVRGVLARRLRRPA